MILLIGGMGFIGLNTALRLLEVGEPVVITQHSSHRIPDLLKDEIGKRVFTARMDVTNAYEVFDVVRRHRIESIINLMAPPARSISTRMWRAASRWCTPPGRCGKEMVINGVKAQKRRW